MLSRTAESLYWTGRYMERADFLARILEAAVRLAALPARDGAAATAWASAIACVLCLAHFAATRPLALLVQPAPVMGLAVAMALFSTVLPVWMVSEAIRRLGAGPVSLIGTLGPVVTLFLGWLILAEPIGVYQLVGGALVIAGVLLVGSKR